MERCNCRVRPQATRGHYKKQKKTIVSKTITPTNNAPTVAAVHIHTDIQARQGDDPS